MKAIKATYQNGQVSFSEPAPEEGPVEILVVFPEQDEDPWEKMLNEPTPRPAFAKFMQECLDEIAQGKAVPLDLDQRLGQHDYLGLDRRPRRL